MIEDKNYYFGLIFKDSTITECVLLDAAVHPAAVTLNAFSQFITMVDKENYKNSPEKIIFSYSHQYATVFTWRCDDFVVSVTVSQQFQMGLVLVKN